MIHITVSWSEKRVKVNVRSKIDTYLENRGTSKAWLARQIGVTRSQVNNWSKNDEDGNAKIQPTIGFAMKMVKILGCEFSDLWELKED